jgi:hypothetical protein
MKKIKLGIGLVLISLCIGCNRESNNDGNHFVLLGTAENLKSGACVISDGIVYQIDRKDAWDKECS